MASSFSSVQLLLGGVFYVILLLPLSDHLFKERLGQTAWGKTRFNVKDYYAVSLRKVFK